MEFKHFSRNGELRPIEEAVVPLANIEYQYGFGVYESIRVVHGTPYFLPDHLERLMESARIIGLVHPFDRIMIHHNVEALITADSIDTCNLKILLIGGNEPELFLLCLNPHFPDKKWYADGVKTITYAYERAFPHAKTLNMLQSYLAHRKAKAAGAYDALLIDREGNITEGTRTNFFCIKGKTLFSPPEEKILLGVTRKAVLNVAAENGFTLEPKHIRTQDLGIYDGAFLTSTSSKILPVRSVDEHEFGTPPQALNRLMSAFDHFLVSSGGKM